MIYDDRIYHMNHPRGYKLYQESGKKIICKEFILEFSHATDNGCFDHGTCHHVSHDMVISTSCLELGFNLSSKCWTFAENMNSGNEWLVFHFLVSPHDSIPILQNIF